jgi:hypothetical protein
MQRELQNIFSDELRNEACRGSIPHAKAPTPTSSDVRSDSDQPVDKINKPSRTVHRMIEPFDGKARRHRWIDLPLGRTERKTESCDGWLCIFQACFFLLVKLAMITVSKMK